VSSETWGECIRRCGYFYPKSYLPNSRTFCQAIVLELRTSELRTFCQTIVPELRTSELPNLVPELRTSELPNCVDCVSRWVWVVGMRRMNSPLRGQWLLFTPPAPCCLPILSGNKPHIWAGYWRYQTPLLGLKRSL
jgi:hypothetical protein